MAKVHIGKDTYYAIFVWDKSVLDIVDPKGEYNSTIEVPDELLAEYNAARIALFNAEDKLEEYYERIQANGRAKSS